ncbi:O-antigen ligase [Thalassobacillus sp. CUG 92003]|uniref:O-antigen ligase family protein n=1 Tax=Thalassobacillus sp. CUG 92003 TaxID=2736641 RepID=UPI0015E6EA97|nr:O-antigen ligase family protein [Thalassobacillus sp. CUG 92003]
MPFNFKQLIFIPVAILAFLIGCIFDNSVVGLVVTIGFGLFALWNPKSALALLFFYFPIRPFLLEFNPSLKGIGDIIIIFIVLKIAYMQRKNLKSLFHFHWFEWGYFGFLIVGAVSAFLTGVAPTAIIFQLRAFLLFYLLYYIVKRLEINKEDIKKVAWTVFIITIIICVHGLIEKLSLRGLLLPESWANKSLSANNRIRIYGLIGNPNMLAAFLSFAFIVFLYLKEQLKENRKAVRLMNISLVLLMGVWFLTYSRGTFIAFSIAFLIYIALTRNWRTLAHWLIPLAIGILLIGLPANMITNYLEDTNFGKERNANQNQDNESSFSDRMSGTFNSDTIESSQRSGRLWITMKGFSIYPDHPVIGTGFGTFGDSATLSYGSPIYDDYNINREFYSDNQYIQIIVQSGTVGVVLFAIFLLNMLYLIVKQRKASPHFASLMISILLGAYAGALVYNVWELDVFTLFYFSMLGYFLYSTPYKHANEE